MTPFSGNWSDYRSLNISLSIQNFRNNQRSNPKLNFLEVWDPQGVFAVLKEQTEWQETCKGGNLDEWLASRENVREEDDKGQWLWQGRFEETPAFAWAKDVASKEM